MSSITAYQFHSDNPSPSPVPTWVKPSTPLQSVTAVKPHPTPPPLASIKENFTQIDVEENTKLHEWRLLVLVGMVTFFACTISGVSIMLFLY